MSSTVGWCSTQYPLCKRTSAHVVERSEIDVGFVKDGIKIDGSGIADIERAEYGILISGVASIRVPCPA